jgi:hypothetical protein
MTPVSEPKLFSAYYLAWSVTGRSNKIGSAAKHGHLADLGLITFRPLKVDVSSDELNAAMSVHSRYCGSNMHPYEHSACCSVAAGGEVPLGIAYASCKVKRQEARLSNTGGTLAWPCPHSSVDNIPMLTVSILVLSVTNAVGKILIRHANIVRLGGQGGTNQICPT